MRLLYGARFAQTYGDTPNVLWLEAIGELTDDDCRRGFAALRESREDWPPSLPKFVGLCKPKSAGVRYYGVPLTDEQRANLLPPPDKRAKPETRDAALASIRKTLGVG